MEQPPRVEVTALPTRSYLENSVVPVLTQGLEALTLQSRPQRPLEYLAKFMLKNVPPRPDPLSNVKAEVIRLVPRPLANEVDATVTYHKCTTSAILPVPLVSTQAPTS
ncbi:hypothetical protein SELMODRAFT_429190 [Selaginella moellendorffii]|uniref:Uncharacterized protein n=1 Tax=Selaginella moellendorffii TaxID=88036 RepID=D8T5B9_SELML|nr:hypothetical protein SELMODRAFT_429190 [Selaginella moellendorffii]